MTNERASLGGVTYNPSVVQNAVKLKDGRYRLTFKDGSTFTYNEQEKGNFLPFYDIKKTFGLCITVQNIKIQNRQILNKCEL